MPTLKEQLVKLGLAEEASDKRGNGFDEAMIDAPLNRLGKPQVWYKWLIRNKLPTNMSGRCCMCGQYRKTCDKLERNEQAIEIERKLKKLKPNHLAVCGLCEEE